MVIYTHNLAEKLFGFAHSKEQLRNTALCGILDDPRLALDIDLAIDFNAAVRGDEDAAERFTNTFILSSAYIDYSTADFYTTRMEQYPVFEYHVDRINYIFNNLDNLGDYYAFSNANERNFLNRLLDALKDCLNSPCNLFAASSESIASITDMAAMSNSTTIPPFQELKSAFKNAYGGLKTTLVKRLPDAVSDMFIELGTIGQGAWAQSVDMLYSKDPEKKKKIIDNALAGKALDSDSTSYSYIPDLDAFTSVEGFATAVLSQAASDLGGCFRKYQHLARYSPFNPDQNLSRTSANPVSDTVDGKGTYRNSFGVYDWDYQNRSLNLCKGGISGTVTPDVDAPIASYNAGEKNNKLAMDRLSRFSGELGANKEQILARLQALAAIEVGSNPAAQQAFIETVVNRAYFSNRSLNTILYEPAYGFTGTDTASPSPGLRAAFDNVFAGSNLTNLATDAGYNLPGAGPGGSNFITGNKEKQIMGVMDLYTGQLITDSNLLNTLNTEGDTTGRYEYFVRQDRRETTRAGIDLYAKSRGIN